MSSAPATVAPPPFPLRLLDSPTRVPLGRRLRMLAVLVLVLPALPALAQLPPVTTRAFDNDRSGWNPNETILSQASITAKGLSRLTTIPVIGDARGEEAQPLILPAVKLANGSTHDVMVLPSMANVVRGVDAETGAGLWQITLDTPITSSAQIDFHQINQHWGCLSTGVLIPATRRVYLSCWISTNSSGTPASGRYFMVVLSVVDGSQVVAPVPLQGTDTSMWKQRSSLLLTTVNGVQTIFLAHGSVFETSAGYTGGVIAFDVAGNKVTAVLPLSAGVWMGGQGIAADAAGNLYFGTGNGDFDPTQGWYGESFLKVQYTPPSGSTAASLKVVDWWTPWTDDQRTGQTPLATPKLAGESAPSEAVKPVGAGMSMPMSNARLVANMNAQGQPVVLAYPQMATGAWADEDLWSGGPALLEAIGLFCGGGKDGILYCAHQNNLGKTMLADLANPQANCGKLAFAPVWATMDPGPVAACPANPQTLNFFPWGDTAHMHSTPVQLYDPILKSWVLFVWGENQQLHKWAISATGVTYVAEGHEFASVDVRGNPPGGMPGGFCSGSSHGSDPNSMLLLCSIPYNDANARIGNGRLLVYDPIHLATDGSLKVLWDSQQWGIPYLFNKFMPPIVWNGRVYLPNYNGGVDVYQ